VRLFYKCAALALGKNLIESKGLKPSIVRSLTVSGGARTLQRTPFQASVARDS
jgi:hypothetical protein